MNKELIAVAENLSGKGQSLEPYRLLKLNDEQKDIVLKREEERQTRLKMYKKLGESNDIDERQQILDALRDLDLDRCEHDRSIWKSCAACDEIDKLMFPELFDENGDPIEDE